MVAERRKVSKDSVDEDVETLEDDVVVAAKGKGKMSASTNSAESAERLRTLQEELSSVYENRGLLAPPMSESERKMQGLRQRHQMTVEGFRTLLELHASIRPDEFLNLARIGEHLGPELVQLVELQSFALAMRNWQSLARICDLVVRRMEKVAEEEGLTTEVPETPLLDEVLKVFSSRAQTFASRMKRDIDGA